MKLCFFLILFFFTCGFLSAQSALQFEEYDDLHPDINLLGGNNTANSATKRILLFFHQRYSEPEPVLIYDTLAKEMRQLSPEQVGMERKRIRSQYFWDPHTKKTYMFYASAGIFADEISGWYQLGFDNDFLVLNMHNKDHYWAHYSPPFVQLTSDRVFVSQYIYHNKAPYEFRKTTLLKVTDTKTGKTLWEFTDTSTIFTDMLWITERWYIKQSSPRFITYGERSYTIVNYETGETVSFAPECIIGYGDGVILTTTETEKGLLGITVWTPEKKILYRDSTFSISGIVNRGYGLNLLGKPGVYISYFDYPYIYCNVSWIFNGSGPIGTLIMNLEDGKTCFSPRTYHLYGIFEAE